MKLFLPLLLTFFICNFAFPCTNFAGTYVAAYDGKTYTIEQNECVSLIEHRADKTRTFIADGVARVIEDTNISTVTSTAVFKGDTLVIETTIKHKKLPPNTDKVVTRATAVDTKDAAGNVVYDSVFYNSSNQVVYKTKLVDKKI